MATFVQLCLNGMVAGAVYALAASGYSLAFSMRVNNFAHGALMVFGAYLSHVMVSRLAWPFPAALLASLVLGMAAGALLYPSTIRPWLRRQRDDLVLASTLAVALIVESVIMLSNGPVGFNTRATTGSLLHVGPGVMTTTQVMLVVTAVAVSTTLVWVMRCTWFGRMMSAVAHDFAAAESVGIPAESMQWVAIMISTSLAFMAGTLISRDIDLYAYAGTSLLLKVYVATIIGGGNHAVRVMVSAFLLGILESLVAGYLSTEYSLASTLVALVIVLMVRREGLGELASARHV